MSAIPRPSAAQPADTTPTRFLVVGAGPAGLAAAAALRAAGVPFDMVDRHTDVGGLWDAANPDTPLYASAHFISSRTLSGFADQPMPADYPDYPGHARILAYLRSYARKHAAYDHFEGGREVTAVRPLGPGDWEAVLDGTEHRRYRGVITAHGRQREPNLPDYPGRFTGEAIHAREYSDPGRFHGRRVLVVGAGNSGADIACDAAFAAAEARLSMRRGYHFIPKYVFGLPADVFGHRGPQLPTRLRQALFSRLLRVYVGPPSRYGLPDPDHRIFESHPILNDQVLHHLGHGDLRAVPDIARFDGPTVHFTDGSSWQPDLVVYATGYRITFPFLPEELIPWRDGAPDLYLNTVHRDRDDLFVLGLLETDGGLYPLLNLQAALTAQAIVNAARAPELARRFAARKRERPDLTGGVRHLHSQRHAGYVHNRAYRRALTREVAALRRGAPTRMPATDDRVEPARS